MRGQAKALVRRYQTAIPAWPLTSCGAPLLRTRRQRSNATTSESNDTPIAATEAYTAHPAGDRQASRRSSSARMISWRPTESGNAFALLTCGFDGDPGAHVVGAVHPKAVPVILHDEDYDRWLTAPIEEALGLACAYPSQLLAMALSDQRGSGAGRVVAARNAPIPSQAAEPFRRFNSLPEVIRLVVLM